MKSTVEDCEKVIRMCNRETVKRILKEVDKHESDMEFEK